ncbi:MAG: hypothetical protein HY825_16050 [Acidobacteria bacterium]|nr:hypothetical protein [Acidobacteriota bacterium]
MNISSKERNGLYLIVEASRGGHVHRVALLYSSGTDNKVYKQLSAMVEHIFFNGEPYHVESFAHGISTPVGPVDGFHDLLVKWNAGSTDGKFAPAECQEEATPVPTRSRLLLSETPIRAIWLRVRQLQSVTLASKVIERRVAEAGRTLDAQALRKKAEGLAYALRNASDYFQVRDGQSVGQRVLNLYYGTLSFAFAEMLAAPDGPATLEEIEASTKFGHGLFVLGQDPEDLVRFGPRPDDLDRLVVGILASGFFPTWMQVLGSSVESVAHMRPRNASDLVSIPEGSWTTIEQLFARIPEISDLFLDIFASPPAWLTPVYSSEANERPFHIGAPPTNASQTGRTYLDLIDLSGRLGRAGIAALPGPLAEIREMESEEPGRHFRVAVEHHADQRWFEVLPVHLSPFAHEALIGPVFGSVGQFRAISTVLLYGLSIVVRYQPSLWRRVQEGDLDHMRALVEAFLDVVERILPEEFLEQVSGQRLHAKQPGTL